MPLRTSPLRLIFVFLLSFAAAGQAVAAPMTFVHLAGSRGGRGYDDGAAAEARFRDAGYIAADAAGNLYVTDRIGCTIRKILPSGEVRTLAGLNDAVGNVDGKGSAARFWNPLGIAVDSHGNLFVAENEWKTIRKITPLGVVTTFAGTPDSTGSHVDGFRSAARFEYPAAIAIDASDNLYVGDLHYLRKITPDGNVTTLAGNGNYTPMDGTGTGAQIHQIGAMVWDPSSNSLVLTEIQESIVRRVTLPGVVVTTIAGQMNVNGHTNGNGSNARFFSLQGLAVNASGTIWVSEGIGSIRTISPSNDVADLAGGYFVNGAVDGTGSAVRFQSPGGMVFNPANGRVYICDTGNRVVRELNGNAVTTFAGTLPTSGVINGAGSAARFAYPSGLALDSTNSVLYVADRDNNVIRRVALPAGDVTTFAGSGTSGYYDSSAFLARFARPQGVALDPSDNSLLVADTDNNAIRRVAPNGDVTTYAGSTSGISGTTNGDRLIAARFYGPQALAFDPPRHRLLVADGYNHKLRAIDTASGIVSDVVRSSDSQPVDFSGFNVDNVAVDGSGNILVGCGNKVTKITPAGVVSVLAGAGDNLFLPGPGQPYDGTGTAARFGFPGPSTVAVNAAGDGYVADILAGTIRSITSGGVVQTVAGSMNHYGSADGTGTFGEFGFPRAVVRYGERVIVADEIGLRISVPQIPDAATAPASIAVGSTIQLGTTGGTATSWQWSVIRRPAGSSAAISNANAAAPTFTPDFADRYTFRLVATGPGGTSITTVSVDVTQVPHHFRVTAAGPVTAGSDTTVTVQAVDAVDSPIPYTGAIHFSSNDPNASLSADYMFGAEEEGAHTFAAIFRRAGIDSITVTSIIGPAMTGTGTVSVSAAAPATLSLTAVSPARIDTPSSVTVSARDAFGNVAPAYTGTVHFTSASDPNATLPAEYAFTGADAGTKTFAATFRTAGTQTLTVYDVATPGPLHASANVIVSAPYVTGDIDHNGSSDLYWRNYANGTNAMWLMNGASLYLVVNLPALPNPSYRLEAVADFDRDGDPDLVWRNASTGANALWLLSGSSIKSIVNLPALPNPDYHISGAADFDGDGGPDLLWRNAVTGANALWMMTGTSFTSVVNLPTLPSPDYHLEGAGDFNNDGSPDLVWRNTTTGANALWLMTGTSLSSVYNLPALPNAQYRVGAIGDYDGDRNVDLVWRNTTTGANAMWKMNGLAFGSVIDLPALPNPSYEMAGAK